MLNLAQPKNIWNDVANESLSESPRAPGRDNLNTASLVSHFGSMLSQDKQREDGNVKMSNQTGQDGYKFLESEEQTTPTVNSNMDENDEQTQSLVRPSAIVGRRHLQRPPRNINVLSPLSPSRYHMTVEGSTLR